MITYLGMTFPAATWALFEWLRNPYTKREVKVARMTPKKWTLLTIGTAVVTLIMWRVLAFFNTPNLIISTVSIATSFFACMLVVLRSPYYALFYGLNDIVLITLWVLASIEDPRNIPMIVCFVIFLANDTYGFINWRRMESRQKKNPTE
ncbi:MAG: nicotinamide mononucleotide transporter, partial [Oscillospiraceae bacterium]|nr:nicotinamide mononucleotide transporter [Oscillospiraceae bacterium]